MPDKDELVEFLKNELAYHKIQSELSKRFASKMLGLCVGLIVGFVMLSGIFATSTYLMSQEQTKQIRTIFDAAWEVSTSTERAVVDQDISGTVSNNSGNISIGK